MERYIKSLKCSRFFENASSDSLLNALTSSSFKEHSFASGERVDCEDKSRRYVGVILSGSARVHSADGERSVLLRKLEVGDVFGIATLFEKNTIPKISTISADKPCRVLFIEESCISFLLENDKNFMYSYINFLSGRIRFLNMKIMFYTSGSEERRLALYLDSFKTDTVTPDMPMNALSELLDIGRASLYRAIDSLVSDGFIKRDGDEIIIIDRDKMLDFYKIKK